MNIEDRTVILDALSVYGATLTDENAIKKGDSATSIVVEVKKGRFRYLGGDDLWLLASSPKTKTGVCKFIDAFWFWDKLNKIS